MNDNDEEPFENYTERASATLAYRLMEYLEFLGVITDEHVNYIRFPPIELIEDAERNTRQPTQSDAEAMRYGFDGFGYKYIDSGSGSDWRTRHPDAEPLYLGQPTQSDDPAAEWQAGYEAGVEAAVKALEADAKLCDCFALEDRECGCGAWDDYKSITSARAVEIVRALNKGAK